MLVALAVVGIVTAARRGRLTLPLTWLAAAAAGFAVGGLYHPHYWMQLAAPLALLAALGLDAIAAELAAGGLGHRGPGPRHPAGLLAARLRRVEPGTDLELTSKDYRLVGADDLGRYVASITGPDDHIAVLWADAAVYWYADRTPAFRYLWFGPAQPDPRRGRRSPSHHHGRRPSRGRGRGDRSSAALDPRGEVLDALATRYDLVRRMGTAAVYRLRAGLPVAAPVT